MANKLATVETTAVFFKYQANGKTFYKRAPFNLVVRDYGNGDTRGRKSYIEFAYPDRVGVKDRKSTDSVHGSSDDGTGDVYDAVVYWDSYPPGFPRIGISS